MGRRMIPDGRRTVVGIRLSDAELERLDSARGAVVRADFCRALVLAGIGPGPQGAPDVIAGIRIITDDRMPPGTAAIIGPDHDGNMQVQPLPVAAKPRKPRARKAPAAPVAAPEPEPKGACKHPHVLKGWCRDCQTGGHY